MPKGLYPILVSAPAKIGGFAATVLGAAGTLSPEWMEKNVGSHLTSQLIQQIGFGLLVIAALYFFLLWWLKPDGEEGVAATSVSTSGRGSPAIGSARDVYINTPPPPVAKSGVSSRDDPDFYLTSPKPREAASSALPDMELREVCNRLYNSLGGPPQLTDEFERRVDLEIKDNVRHRRLHTWGRMKPDEALDDVWSDAWVKGDFSHKRGLLLFRHPDNPTHPIKWSDLRFCRLEVDRWLPPPREPPNRPKNLGPGGWMA